MGNQFLKGLQRPAIMPEGSSLPDYSEANEGDVLQIQGNEPVWGAVEALPEIEETDEGKVLSVDQGEAVWADAPSGLPEITNADEGKVLTVVERPTTINLPLFAQQTAVVESGASVEITSPQNLDKFVVGASVTVNVNGTDYTVTVADVDGNPAATLVSEPAEDWMAVTHWSHDDTLTFEAYHDGTYVISATVAGKELVAGWATPSGGEIPTATEENLGMGLIVGRKMIEFVPDQTITLEGTGTIYSAQVTGATRYPDDLTEGQTANATITVMGQSSSMPISYTDNISGLSLPGFAVSMMGINLYLFFDTDSWYFGTDDATVEGASFNLAVDLAEGFAPTWGCPKILVGESIEVYYDGTSHETMIVISDSDYNELKEGDLVFAPVFSGSPVVQEYIANTYQVATSGMNAYRVKTEFTLDPVYQVVGTSHATIISASIKANNLQYVMG